MKQRKRLSEIYDIRGGIMRTKNGKDYKIIYIDPKVSESTFEYKDKIKNEFGGTWFTTLKTWGWFTGDDEASIKKTIETKVKPCVNFLLSVEKKPAQNNDGTSRTVLGIIDRILNDLKMPSGTISTTNDSIMSVEEIEDKLLELKERLVKSVSAEDFKKQFEPIIKFRRAQGHKYSLYNTILIFLQKPDAKLVKPRGVWKTYNRQVKEGAKSLFLYYPMGNKYKTKAEKERIINSFLKNYGVKTVDELSVGQKDELRVALKSIKGTVTFKLQDGFYDVSDTVQIEGTEDLVGGMDNTNDDNIQWFENGEETEETVKLVNAMLTVISNSGVKLSYSNDLGGALGVSRSGEISVLKGAKKDIGMFDTLIHEFAHEMLHQKFLSSKNEDLKTYFIGKEQGRQAVEQQAELVAWIVMGMFGYDLNTSLNYTGLWGMDDTNAALVFDVVSNVASKITTDIEKVMQNQSDSEEENAETQEINESDTMDAKQVPSGQEIANMLGAGKIYNNSKKAEIQRGIDYNSVFLSDLEESELKLKKAIEEAIERFVNRS